MIRPGPEFEADCAWDRPEDELVKRRPGAATTLLGVHRRSPVAISIITLGEFAEGFTDPKSFGEFMLVFESSSSPVSSHGAPP